MFGLKPFVHNVIHTLVIHVYILIRIRNAKKIIIHLFLFPFYYIENYFSDINFDRPVVNSLSNNLKITTLRLTLDALPRKSLVIPFSIAKGL